MSCIRNFKRGDVLKFGNEKQSFMNVCLGGAVTIRGKNITRCCVFIDYEAIADIVLGFEEVDYDDVFSVDEVNFVQWMNSIGCVKLEETVDLPIEMCKHIASVYANCSTVFKCEIVYAEEFSI